MTEKLTALYWALAWGIVVLRSSWGNHFNHYDALNKKQLIICISTRLYMSTIMLYSTYKSQGSNKLGAQRWQKSKKVYFQYGLKLSTVFFLVYTHRSKTLILAQREASNNFCLKGIMTFLTKPINFWPDSFGHPGRRPSSEWWRKKPNLLICWPIEGALETNSSRHHQVGQPFHPCSWCCWLCKSR